MKIAKVVSFRYPSYHHGNHLAIFTSHILLNRKSNWGETLWAVSGWHRDLELLKSVSPKIQDGGQYGNFETLQTTSDSKLLKAILPESQDAIPWPNVTSWSAKSRKPVLACLGLYFKSFCYNTIHDLWKCHCYLTRYTVFTLNIRTSKILIIFVLKKELIKFIHCWWV